MTFSHHKGGTGKTTSCLNIAGFLVKAGKKVLVVDCDPQANATAGLGYSTQSAGRNMYDVFLSGFEEFPETKMSDIIRKTPSGIDLAPSHLDLVGADPCLYRREGRAGILKAALAPLKDQYDFIFVDTPPSMGQLVINGLFASDRVIVTLDSGTFALDGVSTLSTIFGDMKEDLGREIQPDIAIVTRWGEGGASSVSPNETPEKKDIFLYLRDLFYKTPAPTPEEIRTADEQKAEHERLLSMLVEIKRLFRTVYTVPYSPLIYEAQKRGLPISHFAPDSSAGAAYKTIMDDVIQWN
ncbi:AAA family ATPase [Methanoregula sp.]|uniref:ParA family protein n=1 Tax=Methanoregula sp. TaxID=2052170 RepID=UPI0034417889